MVIHRSDPLGDPNMRFPNYVSISRHGVFYVRLVTPKAVRASNPQLPKEIRKSLHTRCPREAVVRSRAMALDWRILITEVSKAMSNKKDNYDSKLLLHPHANGSYSLQVQPGDTVAEVREFIQMLRELGTIPANATVIDEMAYENPTDKEFREAKLAVMDLKPNGPWLSEVIEAFAKEKLQEKQWDENTWTQTYRPLLRDFREIISNQKRTIVDKDGTQKTIWDIPSKKIEEEEIEKYCDSMWRFPMNYGSMKNVGDAKQALNAGLPPQSKANASKKIRMVKTFLIWAYKKKKLEQELDELLPVEKKDKKRDKSKEGFQPWTLPELKKIFERDTYPVDIGWKYWTPILALFTGARANEIAQLQVADFMTTASGIPCISITDLEDEEDDEGPIDPDESETPIKTVKNASSRRWVPIHPKLLELGLLSFVEGMKAKGEVRLFPELPYVRESRYGRKPSRYFSETTKKLGIYKKHKKVFHSFRSTLNGILMKNGMPQELREYVLGHTNDSTNVASYGKRLEDRPYELMLQWLSGVQFELNFVKWEEKYELPQL